MKNTIVIDQQHLREVTAKLGAAAKGSKVLPVLECVLLNVKKAKAVFTASDLDLTIQCTLKVTCEDEFEVLIPYHFLKDVAAIASGTIAIVREDKALKIVHANDELKLPLLDVADFPKVPEIKNGTKVNLGDGFGQSMQLAALSVSKDTKKPHLMCVCLDFARDGMRVVSTDGFTIYVQQFLNETSASVKGQVLIPGNACASIPDSNLDLTFSDTHASFETDNTKVIVRRCDAKYVDWEKVMSSPAFNLTLNQQEFQSALMICALADNQVGQTAIVPGAKEVLLQADFIEKGNYARASIPGAYTGTVASIAVVNAQMLRVLKQLGTCEEIELAITAPNKIIMLRRKENSTTQCAVIPIYSQNSN